jgi:Mrp family chromosome partitioning ATPase
MTTGAIAEFGAPEDAALELELPLLGMVRSPADESGPIAPSYPADERTRREYHRAADRILLSPLSAKGSVGLIGDVSSLRRARIAADLSTLLAAEKTSILVDADLGGAHLSFDERGRSQEGLVDVLRYGVRSPRVVAPTQAPGLNLLPVGSGTVDFASTYGSDSTASLFAELRRTGDLVIVNGPDLSDLDTARPFLAEVAGWVLVHDFGASVAARTRELKEIFGADACVGVLAVVVERPPSEELHAPSSYEFLQA